MSQVIVHDFTQQTKAAFIPVIEWKGQRVITTEELARGFEVEPKALRQNLSNNRSRFVVDKDYFILGRDDIQRLNRANDIGPVNKHTSRLMLWTERGAARMSKIMDSDPAWEFHQKLVDTYFRARELVAPPQSFQIPQDLGSALRLAADLADRVHNLTDERDHALRTKGQISTSREALAMQRLGYEKRQTRELQYELNQTREALNRTARERDTLAAQVGATLDFATVARVEKARGQKYSWQPLRAYCKEKGLQPRAVADERFGTVKSWPAAAWLAVHGVDIAKLG